MRIAVMSDSHGDLRALDALMEKMGHIDAACFLGDVAGDSDYLREKMAQMEHEPILYAVRGNNDLATTLPYEMTIELAGKRIFLTHGHRQRSDEMRIAYTALENGAQIALFGHTHAFFCETVCGVLLLNPGSAGNYCRGGAARAAVLTIENGEISVETIVS